MAFRAALRPLRSFGARAARRAAEMPKPVVAAAASVAVGGVACGFYAPTSCANSKLVDVSSLTSLARTDDIGLLPQPDKPKYKTALVQIYVPSQPFGGSDKSATGHRYDSIPIANGMIAAGMSCQLLHYIPEEHDNFFRVLEEFDAVIVRCNPGQIGAAGGNQMKFDDAMCKLQSKGKQVWPSPNVMTNMGAKDALCKIADLAIGLPDTLAYYSAEALEQGFKKTMAFQPRVIKQNRGSSGEGIWIIKLRSGNYCKNFGDRSVSDDEVLELMEACDNHAETHTVREFLEFCVHGRSAKSGKWDTIGTGKYLEGGKEAGGQLVDQRFCPRIVEGEIRLNMIGDTCVGIIHKKPKAGGISAVGGTGSIYTFYKPDAPEFAALMKDFTEKDLPTLMKNLDLDGEPLPLWWTSDFINSDPGKPGTPCTQEKWIVGEFNCSCVGISKCLAACCTADNKTAGFFDMSVPEVMEATYYGNLMGQKAIGILDSSKANVSPTAKKIISRIEAVKGAISMGVLTQKEADSMISKLYDV